MIRCVCGHDKGTHADNESYCHGVDVYENENGSLFHRACDCHGFTSDD